MSFLAPGAFLLSLLLPLIVLMYLLKLRRIEQPVSSVYLWQRMVRDVQANSPWQRLRRNLLLLLQLLFLAALILALARPFTWQSGVSGQAAIFIIDTSASMAATDVAPTRLEAAKDQVRRLVDDLPETARVTLIEAGQRAAIAAASSLDRRQVHQAIEGLQPGAAGSDLAVALQLASAIAARQPDTQVILLSDGQAALAQRVSLPANLTYYPIGLRGENQALSLLSLQSEPGGAGLSAFIQVANYGASPAARRLAVFAGDALLQAFDQELAPGAEKPLLVEGLPADAQTISARLLPPEDEQTIDDLPLDDFAIAPQRPPALRRVTLVSQGNRFLETALRLQPGLQLMLVSPTQTVILPAADLTIFDATQPLTTTLPSGALFWINPVRSSQYFSVTGVINNPLPLLSAQDHPVLANLSLDALNILDAAALSAPAWLYPLVVDNRANRPPLLLAGEDGGRRIAVLAFDLRRSDLPLQIAFPILLSNLVNWLAPTGASVPAQVTPGEPVLLAAPLAGATVSPGSTSSTPAISAAFVTRPDGQTVRLELEQGRAVYAGAEQLGVYQVRWGGSQPQAGGEFLFAVNLFSPQESATQPLQTINLAGAGAIQAGQETQTEARRELWRALAFLALGLLMAEWLVYNRAAVARLGAWLDRQKAS